MKRSYNTLGRKLLSVLREGGARKHAILGGLAAHWGHTPESFRRAVANLTEQRLIRARRRQGGIHLEAIQ